MWASCDLHRLIKQQKMKKKKKKKKINKKCKAEKARCWKHQKQKKLRLVFQALVLLFLWFGVLPEWNRSEKLHPRLDGRHIKAQPAVWSRCHYQTLEWPRSVDGTHSLSFTWTCEIPLCVCVCDVTSTQLRNKRGTTCDEKVNNGSAERSPAPLHFLNDNTMLRRNNHAPSLLPPPPKPPPKAVSQELLLLLLPVS